MSEEKITNLDASIILPTYNEAENLPIIIPQIDDVLQKAGIKGEIIVVDDNSPDKTGEVAQKLGKKYPVKCIVRTEERGLATAVLAGFASSRAKIVVVMDADGSHPIDKLPEMIRPILNDKYEATVGTRYMDGGATSDWPLLRKIISKGAALLTLGLTKMKDPTSGFMAISRTLIADKHFAPIGWKIVLEIMVRTNPKLQEVPITFKDRLYGQSKLSIKEQWNYLRHLEKLYEYKFRTIIEFLRFCVVGFSGMMVDIGIIYLLKSFWNVNLLVCNIAGFCVALSTNYLLNRFWSFSHGKNAPLMKSYLLFFLVCLLGLASRLVMVYNLEKYTLLGVNNHYLIISFVGIILASVVNFWGTKTFVFKKERKEK
jgi:dolichol-phosphate mannosyltransferase